MESEVDGDVLAGFADAELKNFLKEELIIQKVGPRIKLERAIRIKINSIVKVKKSTPLEEEKDVFFSIKGLFKAHSTNANFLRWSILISILICFSGFLIKLLPGLVVKLICG